MQFMGYLIAIPKQSIRIILLLYTIDHKYSIKHCRFFVVTKYTRDLREVLI